MELKRMIVKWNVYYVNCKRFKDDFLFIKAAISTIYIQVNNCDEQEQIWSEPGLGQDSL